MLKDLLNGTNEKLDDNATHHKVDANIETVQTVLEAPLSIPPYQRPYMWEKKQVEQLLNDIRYNKRHSSEHYRIGSLITCLNERHFDIVDGQQRVTTLLLILRCLKPSYRNNLFNNLQYNHSLSYKHLKQNRMIIEKWIQDNIANEKEIFFNYILNNCELVVVTVYNISEAFQMFDSQNGNGKELEPYNLLKAYHLRAIKDRDNQERQIREKCHINWENAVKSSLPNGQNFDVLKQLFSEQLYKSRIWSKGNVAYRFAKKDIDEFKGFSKIQYPYQNISLLMFFEWLKNQEGIKEKLVDRDNNSDDPNFIKNFMNVNQDIVDGEIFFQYVETYVAMYKRLFLDSLHNKTLEEFQNFYNDYCFYKGYGRMGDTYLRELFKALVFCFYDKFGITKFEPRFYKILYAFVYRIRIQQSRVVYNTVAKVPIEGDIKPFNIIAQAREPKDIEKICEACMVKKSDLNQLKNDAADKSKRRSSSFVPEIINFFEKESFVL